VSKGTVKEYWFEDGLGQWLIKHSYTVNAPHSGNLE